MGIFDSIKDALSGNNSNENTDEKLTPADVPFDPTLDDPSMAPAGPATTETNAPADPVAPADSAQGDVPSMDVVTDETGGAAEAHDMGVQSDQGGGEFQRVDPAPAPAPEPVAQEPAPAPAPEPAPAPAPEPAAAPQAETYTVEEGDNLTWIGERYGVSVDALVEANNIENPDLIYPGQVLSIPR